jgi:hypothetical protein
MRSKTTITLYRDKQVENQYETKLRENEFTDIPTSTQSQRKRKFCRKNILSAFLIFIIIGMISFAFSAEILFLLGKCRDYVANNSKGFDHFGLD